MLIAVFEGFFCSLAASIQPTVFAGNVPAAPVDPIPKRLEECLGMEVNSAIWLERMTEVISPMEVCGLHSFMLCFTCKEGGTSDSKGIQIAKALNSGSMAFDRRRSWRIMGTVLLSRNSNWRTTEMPCVSGLRMVLRRKNQACQVTIAGSVFQKLKAIWQSKTIELTLLSLEL